MPRKLRCAPAKSSAPVDDTDAHAREEEIIEAAARQQVAVTHTHRRDLARLAKITRELAGKLPWADTVKDMRITVIRRAIRRREKFTNGEIRG